MLSNRVSANDDSGKTAKYCSKTADLLLHACKAGTKNDYYVQMAICMNIADQHERASCSEEAAQDKQENRQECHAQHAARHDLCQLTGEDKYSPDFNPARFVDPDHIGFSVAQSPYFPLKVGTKWRYEGAGETVEVTVTDKIKVIDGVKCRVVRDIVYIDGQLVEDTDDWVAQDNEGNVWYCGERVMDFEIYPDDLPAEPELIAIDGSFKAGRNGDKPGIWVKAYPQPGETYRQEVSWNNAEDAVEVISLNGTASVPATSCNGNCLVTREFTPLEPGSDAYKYYAPGVGMILETNADGERLELIGFSQP